MQTKLWAPLITSQKQPLTVAIPQYAGNWYEAARRAYLLQGITIIDIPYTLKPSHIGLPDNAIVDWSTVAPEKLKSGKETLEKETEKLMSKADMVYLPGNSDSYIAGDGVYDYSKSDTSHIHDPKERTPKPQFQYRATVEAKMLQIAKEKHLPTWGVCAALMNVFTNNGGTLHPYIDAVKREGEQHSGHKHETHKITDYDTDPKGIGYGDIQIDRLKLYTSTSLNTPLLSQNLLNPYSTKNLSPDLITLQNKLRAEDPIRDFLNKKGATDILNLNPIDAEPFNAFHRMHNVKVEPNSVLGTIYKLTHPDIDLSKPIAVNSSHYEGLSKVPENLSVSAKSDEGFPEAIEAPDLPFGLFTLYHPETNVDGQIKEDGKYQYRGIAMEIVRAQALYAKFLKDGDSKGVNRTEAPSFTYWAKTNEVDLNRRPESGKSL